MLTSAIVLGMTGCHKHHDKTPEKVDDPLKDVIEYYIVGKVSTGDAALAGVTVKTGQQTATTDNEGKYKLTVEDPDTYTISFEKSGYLSIPEAKAVIAGNAANRSSINLNVKMSKESEKVEAVANVATTITDKGAGEQTDATASVIIPDNAIGQTTEISVTPYQEPAPVTTEVEAGTVQGTAALTTLVIQSTEPVVLQQPITLTVNNKSSKEIHFEDIEVYSKNNGTKADAGWTKETNATFDAENNRYAFTLKAGKKLAGTYSFRVKNTKVTGNKQVGENNIEPLKYSNAGNLNAIMNYKINFEAQNGWNYITTPESALSSLTGNTADVNGMSAMINDAIEAQEGTSGLYKVAHSLTTNISGNNILYYTNKALYCEKTYTFNLNGNRSIQVKIKVYVGMQESYTNVDATQHSGGNIGG